MPRIRSIKPEFLTDEAITRVSDSCALFFIVLWNFCDDEGKHPLGYNQLVAELGGRWKQEKVKLFISCLVKSGQLRISSDSAWVQVTGWSHQRIDKPRQPKVKAEYIQWLEKNDSTIIRDQSENVRRKDRIGEDRIGSITTTTTKSGAADGLSSKELKAQIETAFEVWGETLNALGTPESPMNAVQENSIGRAIRQLGFEIVCLALEGQRYEAPTETFNPRKHLSIDRVLHKDSKGKSRWEQFRNMAMAERQGLDHKAIALAAASRTPPTMADALAAASRTPPTMAETTQ